MSTSHVTRRRFDPFLHNVDGAEQSSDLMAIQRVLAALEGKEVLMALDDGRLEVVEFKGPLTLIPDGPFDVDRGQPVAISYHREIRYAAFRTRIQAVTPHRIELERPQQVIFWPGRGNIRLESALGAQITLEHEGVLRPAQGVDISIGGVGVRLSDAQGITQEETLVVHLTFDEEIISLPAQVKSISRGGEGQRLGLAFSAPCDSLMWRIQEALQRGQARHLPPHI